MYKLDHSIILLKDIGYSIKDVMKAYKGFTIGGDWMFNKYFFIRYPEFKSLTWSGVLQNIEHLKQCILSERSLGNPAYTERDERAILLFYVLASDEGKHKVSLFEDSAQYNYVKMRLQYQSVLCITDETLDGKVFSCICSKNGDDYYITGRLRIDLMEE